MSDHDKTPVPESSQQSQQGSKEKSGQLETPNPATEVIEHDVLATLEREGLAPARASLRRAPAWTSDWITEEGRRKLEAYGIAPPGPAVDGAVPIRVFGRRAVPDVGCPRCGSRHTERLSAFGSTACKAMYRCLSCREPFEHFKPI